MPAVAALAGLGATREAAMRAFRSAFETCLSFIGAEGWAAHAGHMAWSAAQAERWRRQREGTEPRGYG
ncbi:hypothetical protein [Bosea sp. 124]|uniref:hypothetical protein n=1 Tax=Bosea sp. 124 TaxID=2135642 RepID=UPI0011B282DB|nr:hypothetical protein [Bosea sp. 124]